MPPSKTPSKRRTLLRRQTNLAEISIEKGELVQIRKSKEDPNLIDIISVKSPKRIIRNVHPSYVE